MSKKENKDDGKKILRLLKWENGFVNPIRIISGPQGGAYMEGEMSILLSGEDRDLEVVIYEIKEVKKCKLKDL